MPNASGRLPVATRTTCCDSASAGPGNRAPCRRPPRPSGRPRARSSSGLSLLQHPEPDARQVAQRDAHAAGAARRAEPIDRDVGAALGAGRLPDPLAHQVGIAGAGGALDHPAEQVAVGRGVVETAAVGGVVFLEREEEANADPKASRRARAGSSRWLCGIRRSARTSRGSSRPRRCRRACRAGGGWSRRGKPCRATSGTISSTGRSEVERALLGKNLAKQAEHRLGNRHQDVGGGVGHAVGVALEHQLAAMQDGDAVGIGLAQESLQVERLAAVRVDPHLQAAFSAGSSRMRRGSFAMSALGISSRTWWKAQRLKGELRQLASVTCI